MRALLLILLFACSAAAAEKIDFPLTLDELGTKTEIRADLLFEQVSLNGKLYFVYNGKAEATVLDLQLTPGETVKQGTFFLLLDGQKKKVRVYMAQDVTVQQIRPALGRYSTIKRGDILAIFQATPDRFYPPDTLTPYQEAEKLLARINQEDDDAVAENLTKRLMLLLQIAKKESTPAEAAKAMVMEFYIRTEQGERSEKLTGLLVHASSIGNGEASYLLGRRYRQEAPKYAMELFQRALDANFPGAGIEYGLACYKTDKNRAKDAFHADALRGIAKAQNLYGVALLKEGQFAEGKKWIEKAAAKQYPPALNNLGVFARNGNTEGDLKASVQYFTAAANAGYAPAKRNLAQAYWDGFGIPADTVKAKQLATEAAEAGDRAANYLLGMMAITDKPPGKAFPFYLKAAEAGYPPACLQVSLMYRQGNGVKADSARADYWLERREKIKSDADGKTAPEEAQPSVSEK